MRRFARAAASALVAVLIGLGGVLVLPAGATSAAEGADAGGADVLVTRYGGADRYETSLLIANALAAEAGGSLETVVLVSGEHWTDAVVAAPLAGSLNAPVLMTPTDELHADVASYLSGAGISHVVLMGGTAALGADVEQATSDMGIDVNRLAGATRYDTAVKAA